MPQSVRVFGAHSPLLAVIPGERNASCYGFDPGEASVRRLKCTVLLQDGLSGITVAYGSAEGRG